MITLPDPTARSNCYVAEISAPPKISVNYSTPRTETCALSKTRLQYKVSKTDDPLKIRTRLVLAIAFLLSFFSFLSGGLSPTRKNIETCLEHSSSSVPPLCDDH
jgi:hypothetical protein